MNKPYLNIPRASEASEGEQPPEHLTKLLNTIQSVIDRAYQDGYEACVRANLFGEKESVTHE